MSKRRSKADWIEAGIELLKADGAMTVDALCRAVGRTKGSFYHHFGDLTGFQDALLSAWEQQFTEGIIKAAEQLESPADRWALVDSMARSADFAAERAIRHWAFQDARVQQVVARVDERRIAYLASTFSGEDAYELATIEYAAFVGVEHLFIALGEAHSVRLSVLLRRALQTIDEQGAS